MVIAAQQGWKPGSLFTKAELDRIWAVSNFTTTNYSVTMPFPPLSKLLTRSTKRRTSLLRRWKQISRTTRCKDERLGSDGGTATRSEKVGD